MADREFCRPTDGKSFPELQCTGYFIRIVDRSTPDNVFAADINSDSLIPIPVPGEQLNGEGIGDWIVREREFKFLEGQKCCVLLYCDPVTQKH